MMREECIHNCQSLQLFKGMNQIKRRVVVKSCRIKTRGRRSVSSNMCQHLLMISISLLFVINLNQDVNFVHCSLSSSSSPSAPLISAPSASSLISTPNQQHRQQQYFKTKPPSIIEINEGSNLIIKCEVGHQAGPVQWVKNGFLLGFNRSIPGYPRYSMIGHGNDGIHNLRIEGAKIEDEGEYQCQVGPGPGSKAIRANSRLSVLYAARIKRITEMSILDEGKDAVLECEVDANPISTVVITWKRRRNLTSDLPAPTSASLLTTTAVNVDEFQFSYHGSSSGGNGSSNDLNNQRTSTKFERNRSQLIIKNVSKDDSGSYECLAFNGIGYEDSATANLVVKHKPMIDRSPILLKEAGSDGETGRLICRARGAPNVTFSWFREGSKINSKTAAQCRDIEEFKSQKYWIKETARLDLITFQSELLINKVNSADYGLYKCIARNILGFDTNAINFSHPIKPDAPLALMVINRTFHSVTLKWIPGFDGGLQQSYRIRYRMLSSASASSPTPILASSDGVLGKEVDETPFIYMDVYPKNTTTFEVGPLSPSTIYTFSIMAYNMLGDSEFTKDIVKGETLQAPPEPTSPEVDTNLLGNPSSPSTSSFDLDRDAADQNDLKVIGSHSLSQPSSGKKNGVVAGEVPKLIIIIVAIIGSGLLLLNIVLVVCFLGKKKKKRIEEDGDESDSTRKGEGTVEMTTTPTTNTPSGPTSSRGSGGSYNHGMMNETSLSGSDICDGENKSERASSTGYSATEYPMQISASQTMAMMNHHQQQHHHQGISTYLIDDNLGSAANVTNVNVSSTTNSNPVPNYYPTSMNPFPNYVQDVTGMTSIPASVADYGTTTIDNKQYIYTIGPNDTIPPTFNTTGTLRSLQALNSIPNNVGVGPYHHPHQHQLNYNYSPSHQHHNQINLNHYSTSSHHQVHVNYDEAPATTHIDVDSGRQTKMSYIGHNGHVVT